MTAITPTPIGTDLLTDIRSTIDRVHELEEQVRRVGSGDIALGVITPGHLSFTPTILTNNQWVLSTPDNRERFYFDADGQNYYRGLGHVWRSQADSEIMRLDNTGVLWLGGGNDSNLYRLTAGWLKTDQNFYASGHIQTDSNFYVKAGALYFGSGDDTNLYRLGANQLKTDDNLFVESSAGPTLLTLKQLGTSYGGTAQRLYSNNTTSVNGAIEVLRGTSGSEATQLVIWFDGKLWWDASTQLYRAVSGTLETKGNLQIGLESSLSLQTNPGSDATPSLTGIGFYSRKTATESHQFKIYTAPVGGGFGVTPNSFSIWDYPVASVGGGSHERFTIQPSAGDPAFLSTLTITSDGDLLISNTGADGSRGAISFDSDTNLYRSAAGALKTDGDLTVGDDLTIGAVSGTGATTNYLSSGIAWRTYGNIADTQAKFRIDFDGQLVWGVGGTTAADTNLYRATAGNVLKTDDAFQAVGDINARVDAATRTIIGEAVSGKAGIAFGSSLDTNLYRENASVLRTDDNLDVGQNLTVGWLTGGGITEYTAAANTAYRVFNAGNESQPMFQVSGAGVMGWGPGGSTAPDTNLYRTGANELKTDDTLRVVGRTTVRHGVTAEQVNIGDVGNSGAAGITFGTAEDTNLYRSSAGNRLVTDDIFQSGAGFAGPSGTTLPASPIDGQEYFWFPAIASNSYTVPYWHMRYVSANNRWHYVGGGYAKYWATGSQAITGLGGGWVHVNGIDLTIPKFGWWEVIGHVNLASLTADAWIEQYITTSQAGGDTGLGSVGEAGARVGNTTGADARSTIHFAGAVDLTNTAESRLRHAIAAPSYSVNCTIVGTSFFELRPSWVTP